MRRAGASPPAALAALGLGVVLLAACGEREFDAAEFVAEANERGAGIELGEPLLSAREGTEVYGFDLEPQGTAGAEDHGGGHEHAGGSLIVTADADAGRAELERCQGAVTLACYRAANVVLAVEGEPGSPELAGLDAAIRALASE